MNFEKPPVQPAKLDSKSDRGLGNSPERLLGSKSASGKSKFLPFVLGFILFSLAGWALWPVFSGQSVLGQESGSQNKLEGPAVASAHSEDLPFLIMRQQPDHVLFAPTAHSRDMCNQCHNFSEEKYQKFFKASQQFAAGAKAGQKQATPGQVKSEQPVQEDFGRAEDAHPAHIGQKEQALLYQPKPLSMQECMSCHAIAAHLKSTTANNSCSTCHK